MAAKNPGNEIVPIGDYAISKSDPSKMAQVMEENIGGSLSEFDLDRVGIPAGGATTWVIPTLEGEMESKTLEGVIVHWKEPRAYWSVSFDESGGGSPPDCASSDSVQGQGVFGIGSEINPSGYCDRCPMSQWGSAPGDKNGQACKQMRVLFMVSPESMLPTAVILPPTSIKPMKKYFLRLAARSTPFYGVVTKLELERTKNSDGINYSEVRPSVAKMLTEAETDQIQAYANAMKSALDRIVLDVSSPEYAEA